MPHRTSSSAPARKFQTLCRVEVERLDVAKGHDGLTRGWPEPVVVFGVLISAPSSFRVLDRKTCQFHRPVQFPGAVSPQGDQRFDLLVDFEAPAAIICVAFAFELDSGRGVAELSAALDSWHRLLFEPEGEEHGLPGPLPVWANLLVAYDAPRSFELLLDGRRVKERLRGDDFIGCSLYGFSAEERRQCERRMHFASRDGKNDWSLSFGVLLRGPRMRSGR